MQIEILPVIKNDLEEILQLQKTCYLAEAELYNDYTIPPLHQDLKTIETEFINSIIIKGVINGQIITSVRGRLENETCYIGKLMVANDWQNKGIGQRMMTTIEQLFKECNRYELFTGFKSNKNIHLYTKLGYKEFKQEKITNSVTLLYLEKPNK